MRKLLFITVCISALLAVEHPAVAVVTVISIIALLLTTL